MVDIRAFASDPAKFQQELLLPTGSGKRKLGDCIQPFQLERFGILNPSIVAVARGDKPPISKVWIEGCKGSSKDTDLGIALIWLIAFSRRPLVIQVAANDQQQADELRLAIKGIIGVNDWLQGRVEVQRNRIVCEATECTIDILTSDALGGHGARPDVVVANELSHVEDEEFVQTLADNASKMPNALFIVATNAGFLNSWQHRWRKIAETNDQWRMHCYKQPPPWVSLAELELARLRNPTSRFMRLWHGIWSEVAGDALSDEDIQACTDATLRPMTSAQPDWLFVAGLDLGIRRDHSAFCVLGVCRRTLEIRLAEITAWKPSPGKPVDLTEIERYILDAHRRFRFQKVLFDPWQAELLSQRLTLQAVPMEPLVFNGANLTKLANSLVEVFQMRRIKLYPDADLLADLHNISIEEKTFGLKITSTRTADGGHADRAISLTLATLSAIEIAGDPRPAFSAWGLNDDGTTWGNFEDFNTTPFQRQQALAERFREIEEAQNEYREEMEFLSRPDDSMPQNVRIYKH